VAIIHLATIEPGKPELIRGWLDRQPWGGGGEPEVLGSYRFDDPAGAVGVEGFLVRRDERLLHVALTYRDAPLAGAEDALVGTTEHSVLGTRWVYAGAADPVAVDCFARALRGRQEPAAMELWDGDRLVGRRECTIQVRAELAAEGATEDRPVRLQQVVDPADTFVDAGARLVARWDGGEAVVACLR
jgi:hypothetical protein